MKMLANANALHGGPVAAFVIHCRDVWYSADVLDRLAKRGLVTKERQAGVWLYAVANATPQDDPAARIRELESALADATARADTAPLAAAAMREKAAAACYENAWPEDGTYPPHEKHIEDAERATVEVCQDAIRAIPLPTPADLLAAALRLPEVAAMRDEAERSKQGWDNVLELSLIPDRHRHTAKSLADGLSAALAALTPAIGETDKGAGE